MQSPRGDTEDQREVFDVFEKFSVDGVLPESAVIPALRHLNQYLTNSAHAELEKEFPAKGLTFEDFLTLFQVVQDLTSHEDQVIVEAFASLDKERTGFIESEQFKTLIVDIAKLPEEEAQALVESSVDSTSEDASKISFNAVVEAITALMEGEEATF